MCATHVLGRNIRELAKENEVRGKRLHSLHFMSQPLLYEMSKSVQRRCLQADAALMLSSLLSLWQGPIVWQEYELATRLSHFAPHKIFQYDVKDRKLWLEGEESELGKYVAYTSENIELVAKSLDYVSYSVFYSVVPKKIEVSFGGQVVARGEVMSLSPLLGKLRAEMDAESFFCFTQKPLLDCQYDLICKIKSGVDLKWQKQYEEILSNLVDLIPFASNDHLKYVLWLFVQKSLERSRQYVVKMLGRWLVEIIRVHFEDVYDSGFSTMSALMRQIFDLVQDGWKIFPFFDFGVVPQVLILDYEVFFCMELQGICADVQWVVWDYLCLADKSQVVDVRKVIRFSGDPDVLRKFGPNPFVRNSYGCALSITSGVDWVEQDSVYPNYCYYLHAKRPIRYVNFSFGVPTARVQLIPRCPVEITETDDPCTIRFSLPLVVQNVWCYVETDKERGLTMIGSFPDVPFIQTDLVSEYGDIRADIFSVSLESWIVCGREEVRAVPYHIPPQSLFDSCDDEKGWLLRNVLQKTSWRYYSQANAGAWFAVRGGELCTYDFEEGAFQAISKISWVDPEGGSQYFVNVMTGMSFHDAVQRERSVVLSESQISEEKVQDAIEALLITPLHYVSSRYFSIWREVQGRWQKDQAWIKDNC